MLVTDVMDPHLVVVDPGASLAVAARRLHDEKASAAVVLDGDRLAGILTERDLVRALVDGLDPATTTVAARMSNDVVTIASDREADDATDLMLGQGFRHLPVVDAGTVVGMLSLDGRVARGSTAKRRPPTDFGTTATLSSFRGPYADGPPAKDLEVEIPPLDGFGIAELRRMVVIYVVLTLSILRALARRVVRGHDKTWFEAGSAGAVDGFIALGPTFVKLGQLIASSPGLFPAPLAAAARRCLDEVPPFPSEEVRKMVAADLGRPAAQVFKSFDDEPLSAASIGQVHACTLPDGREAVVKLQRPGIRQRMTTDLRIMHRLALWFEKTKWGKSANASAAITDLHAVTFQELNPALEAWRQHRFRESIGKFGDNKWITAPEIYWDYCGPHMICMERVCGIPMDDFDGLRERGIDGELVLRRGAKVWAEAVMVHGPFHGDMHAGNIWVLDDGRGCYLDFGIMGELSPEWKDVVRDLFYTFLFDLDFTRVVRAYRRVGVFPEGVGTDEEIGERMGMMFAPMLAAGFASLSLGDLITSAVELMKAYNASAPQELMLIGKQLLYIERYTKVLAPEYAIVDDLFIVKNIFPDDAATKIAEKGIHLPE